MLLFFLSPEALNYIYLEIVDRLYVYFDVMRAIIFSFDILLYNSNSGTPLR